MDSGENIAVTSPTSGFKAISMTISPTIQVLGSTTSAPESTSTPTWILILTPLSLLTYLLLLQNFFMANLCMNAQDIHLMYAYTNLAFGSITNLAVSVFSANKLTLLLQLFPK